MLPDARTDLIVFDGTCVFCSGFAQFITRYDRTGKFRFVTAHSPTGAALYRHYDLDPELMETNIVIVDGKAFTKMASFAAAMRVLGWPWRALAVVDAPPKGLTDWVYDRIARNRYRLGRSACPTPSAALRERIID